VKNLNKSVSNIILLLSLLLSTSTLAQEIDSSTKKKTANEQKEDSTRDFKIMPTISSNPTSGTGAGVMGSLIYQADKNSSPSQALVSGQYTDTKSYNIFAMNNVYNHSDKYHFITGGGYVLNNSSLNLDSPIDIPVFDTESADMEVKIIAIFQQMFVKITDSIYLGGQAYYIKQEVQATNNNGADFMSMFGVKNNSRTALGGIAEYDTRSKAEKIYPRNAEHISFALNYFPKALGSDDSFYNTSINARKYIKGFKGDDVFAMQVYIKYCSEDAPDGALATLGTRNVLRGFPLGQYKTRMISALQAEYRYQITDTHFRLTAFAGGAKLSHGSKGTLTGNRDSNNGDYYSGGMGFHYILQENAGVDYRLDLAYSSDEEVSVYATINQAF